MKRNFANKNCLMWRGPWYDSNRFFVGGEIQK